jgi:hypothetical protein
MQFRLEPGHDRHVLRVADDGTEEPFAVVFNPDDTPSVVDALNASLGSPAQPRTFNQTVKDCHVGGPIVQIGHVSGSVRA